MVGENGRTLRRSVSWRCDGCGIDVPMQRGVTTTCPRCAADTAAAERIGLELLSASHAAHRRQDANELAAMALAWFSTLPNVNLQAAV